MRHSYIQLPTSPIFLTFAVKVFSLGQIKKLAGQTIWYGGSNVAAKLLNSLLTPLLTYLMADATGMQAFGTISLIYSYFGVMNVIFTYGMETGYFRFCNKPGVDRKEVFRTTFGSLLISTLLLVIILYLLRIPIEQAIGLGGHSEYISIALLVITLDTLAAIPYAKLRQDNRPRKYAFTKIGGIVINIIFVVFFLIALPKLALNSGFWQSFAQLFDTVSQVLLANVLGSAFVFFVLIDEWKSFRFQFDKQLWTSIFKYSSPMIIIGLAGMINELVDRQFLNKFYPGTEQERKIVVGIYSANYKISIVITMFIQAFKMAAEPFFFGQSNDNKAPALYARVMNWFVITLCVAFLFTALFLDYWKYYVQEDYRIGLYIVPILLFANIFSGIYYNLSVWYKITDRMRIGIYITVIGALITIAGNYFYIPQYGMLASAWTTLACYFSMVVICYLWGQKYFPIPYNVLKISFYLITMLIIFFVQEIVKLYTPDILIRTATGMMLLSIFLFIMIKKEANELMSMPFIGKHIRKYFHEGN